MTRLNIPPDDHNGDGVGTPQRIVGHHWLTGTAVKTTPPLGRNRNENRRRQVPGKAARFTSFDLQDPSVYQRLRSRGARGAGGTGGQLVRYRRDGAVHATISTRAPDALKPR